MNEKIKSAVIGGLLLGFLSAIPLVQLVDICCCAWALLGGALAVKLYIGKSANPVTVGEGAGIGAIAGLVGGVIYLIVGLPLSLLTSNMFMGNMIVFMEQVNVQMADAMRTSWEQQMNMGIGERFLYSIPGALIWFACLLVFATLGGLIAVPIFEKRKAGSAGPPPPEGFGGPQGGGNPPPPSYGQPGGGYGA
jgi:hypothetical protein